MWKGNHHWLMHIYMHATELNSKRGHLTGGQSHWLENSEGGAGAGMYYCMYIALSQSPRRQW